MSRIFLTTLLVLLTSCGGNVNYETSIPSTPVNLSINIMRDAPELNVPGGFFTITEPFTTNQYLGYGGIVIFHGFDDQFYAYDMACPHECRRDQRLSISAVGTATCSKCHSTYDIGFGTGFPAGGPAKSPLRRYRVSLSGYDLRVTP